MNYSLILKLLGNMFKIESAFMILPLAVSFIFGESLKSKLAFIFPILLLAALGFTLSFIKPKISKITVKDAFAATVLTWVSFSIFGALPYFLSGSSKNFIDSLFESTAGFTTTGTTMIGDVESMVRSVVFWKGLSVWIGGVGVLMFMMAVLPAVNASSINLLRAEMSVITGVSREKILPKIKEVAKIIYLIYISITVLLTILLLLTGMPLYDSLIHAFATAGSAGFSNMNDGVRAYDNTAAEIIIAVFMFLVGISFFIYFYMAKRNFKQVLKDEELRVYCGIAFVSLIIMTINIYGEVNSFGEAVQFSAFQISSFISTTGYSPLLASPQIPVLSQFLLLCMMFVGCCSGSTGGGIKIVRVILLVKTARVELRKMLHPNSVKAITINGKKVDDEIITKTAVFLFIYFAVFFVATLIVSIEGKDIMLTVSSVIAMLSNVGVGISSDGLHYDYSSFSWLSKTAFMICMFLGRLEFFPVLILMKPSVWLEKKSVAAR